MIDPFVNVVQIAGFLITAGAAIGLTWRRRARWEPDIEDVPAGPARVAGLITAVVLAVLWFDEGQSIGLPALQVTVVALAGATLLGLLAYVFLTTVFVYHREVAVTQSTTKQIRMIGGLWLTPAARAKHQKGKPIQTLLAQAANQPDVIWPRPARAFAQQLFILAYIALVCGGTIALTAAALLVASRT